MAVRFSLTILGVLSHSVITSTSKVLVPSIHRASVRDLAATGHRMRPSRGFIRVALGLRLRPIHAARVDRQDMIPFIEDRVELVADGIDELDTTSSRTPRVDNEVLRSILGAHTNDRDSEDFLFSIGVARVGRCEVVHGHGEVAAL